MKRHLLLFFIIALSSNLFAQTAKKEGEFATVPVIERKVVFLKEIPKNEAITQEANYNLIRDWAKKTYANDPLFTTLRYDAKNFEIIIKSKTELLLPESTKGVREKMVMRYRTNAFLFQDKCVVEITDIIYMYENSKKNDILPKTIKAEEFITDDEIAKRDNLQEIKINTRKSTLIFLNELVKGIEKRFGY